MRTCYKPVDILEYQKNKIYFPNFSKENNINPFQGKLKAPSSKQTKYQFDYPNWEAHTKKTEMIKPYVPHTGNRILPFFGHSTNGEYGDFY